MHLRRLLEKAVFDQCLNRTVTILVSLAHFEFVQVLHSVIEFELVDRHVSDRKVALARCLQD